jgi:phage-related minor tail protein
MNTAILLDILLAALMVATIVYAVILNRRLAAFRQGKEELQALIAAFTASTEKARSGIDQLREASEQSAKALQTVIGDARAMREDLGFLVDRGAAIADRLVYDGRGPKRPAAPSSSAPSAPSSDPVASLRKILEATR